MIYNCDQKLGEAIKCQGEWKMTSKSGLGSFCSGLLQTQASCEELVKLVGRMVGRVEVNWKAVLTLVTISTELSPQSDTAWLSLISGMVRTGLEESDQEAFLSGLLLVRQAAHSVHQASLPFWLESPHKGLVTISLVVNYA